MDWKMADERRLTRSKAKALEEYSDSSCSPPKKPKSKEMKTPKSNITKKSKSKEVKALKLNETKKSKSNEVERSPIKRNNRRKQTLALSTEQRLARTESDALYQVKTREKFNIRMSEDARACSVWTLCMLYSGDLLMSDNSNPVLKQINGDTYKIQDVLKLCSTSYSVCTAGEMEAVVALSNSSIQFVSTQDKLVPTRTLKMDHCCLGVCVAGDNIFITDGGAKNVFIYDMDGNVLKKVESGNLFSWNRFIVESDDRDALYITDMRRGLFKMERNGDVIWNCCESPLKGAFDLCTDGFGNVFVSGYESNNIVQIGRDGQYLGEIVPCSMCVPQTSGLCFDRQKSKLFVARYNHDEINVYYLK